jgi:signal transduction histidine kinase
MLGRSLPGSKPPADAASRPRPPLERYVPTLLAAFAVVVCSFLASTYYTETRLADVDRQSAAITREAMPTIVHLAVLRTRLHDLEAALASAGEGGAQREAAARALGAMDAELAAEHGPLSRKDDAVWTEAAKALGSLRDGAYVLLSSYRTAPATATDDLLANLRANIAATDHELGRLIESDATRDRDTSARLEAAEHRVTAIALGLDAASFVLSVGAAFVALRVVRRSLALSERRAHELELFASRVAHDIRGPLTPALLALQLGLKDLDEGHRLRPAFERGVRTLLLVASIVDGLYAFAKSGARPQPGARASLRDAVDGVIAEVGALAAERGVTIDIAPIPAATLQCAPGVLLSILSNLVRNALKYGAAGATRQVTVCALESGHSSIRVEVSDAGPGLPPGSEGSIFEPYVRGTVGDERDLGGLGLGLATVRRLVESHGGSVGVVSRSRQGCRFWFELPAAATESAPEAAMFAPGSALR